MNIALLKSTFAALVLCLAWIGHVSAQTPDGETPAEEAVCDVLKGGTPGLYGLCVAFCEAQDLDQMMKLAKDGGAPGDRILANYEKKRGPKDPDMPCLVSAAECPCFNTTVCKMTKGATCELNDVINVADIFLGQTCDAADTCDNRTGLSIVADDVCATFFPKKETRVFVSDSGKFGFCKASISGEGQNSVQLDGATAQKCLAEINAYDGNGPLDGFIIPCGLGN